MYYLVLIGYLVVILIGIVIIAALSHGVYALCKKMKRKKRIRKKDVARCIVKVVVCVLIWVVIFLSSDMFLAYSRNVKKENLVTEVLEVVLNEEKYDVDPWDNKSIEENQNETYLDKLFKEKLYFSSGSKLIGEHTGTRLTAEYKMLLNDWMKYKSPLSLDLLLSELKFFTGDEIRSIQEIDRDIKAYKPEDVPIDIYIEEFYARIRIALETGSQENIYQIARAANDIVYILEGKPESVYMFMFFATCSIDFYLESLSYDNITETKADIYLKCGVVLEKVKNQLNMVANGDGISFEQNMHLQLLSNTFYEKAYNIMTADDNWCQDYLSYYYGISLYDIGKACGIAEVSHYEKALVLLLEYVEENDVENDEENEYLESCKSYISTITSDYQELEDKYIVD